MRAALAALTALLAESLHAGTAALLIDDLGYSRERARRALALAPPVAVAVLPDAPHAGEIARAANRAGADVLVHLPMAARGRGGAGGRLDARMSRRAFEHTVERALRAVPGAVGVNNHEGSALTAHRGAMDRLMRHLAKRESRLVFIDSRTTSASDAVPAATAAGVGVAQRDVFLDNVREEGAIADQVQRWLTRARVSGCALAIGHPHPETLVVLERALARAHDVERVDIRTYIDRCGTPAPGESPWHASSSPSPKAAKSSRPSR